MSHRPNVERKLTQLPLQSRPLSTEAFRSMFKNSSSAHLNGETDKEKENAKVSNPAEDIAA